MQAFDVLSDPVRRRILELLADGEHSSGDVVAVIGREFGITQSAVSQHLKVLRVSGFATVRRDGARRLYAVDPQPLAGVDAWLDCFRLLWDQPHSRPRSPVASECAGGRTDALPRRCLGTP